MFLFGPSDYIIRWRAQDVTVNRILSENHLLSCSYINYIMLWFI
jgi:hypothetical protein